MLLRIVILISFILFTSRIGSGQNEVSIANYQMEVELDIEAKKVYGKTVLNWTNPSNNTVDYLLFHMYYNAFKNSQSTFMTEGGIPDFLTKNIDQNCGWGWTHISQISDADGNDLSSGIHYVQTDDKNTKDQTVLKVPLKSAAAPHETITINFTWEAKIPQTMPRTGYNKEYFFMAQWFPKVGVYEPAGMRNSRDGGWNCHQYHSNGEYYADFGNYDVIITVPKKYVLASSGKRIDKKESGDKITYRHQVDKVIDFTWSVSPHFIEQRDNYKETELIHYSYAYKADYAERYFPMLKSAMSYLEDLLGPYPYPTLSIVDPPVHGMFTGGMEYPTLISTLSFKFLPDGIKIPETLITHEYIHQYFMQMIATHEVEEPWMDEGLTSYIETRIMDEVLGSETSSLDYENLNISNSEWNRSEFMSSPNRDIGSNLLKSWEYKHGGYGEIAYNKVALWMQSLEGIIGREGIDKILKTYFQKWKFKHPSRKDFIAVVNEVVAEDYNDKFPNGMDWYFEQVLEGTGSCDYAVASISNLKTSDTRGYLTDKNDCEVIVTENDGIYTSKIILRRHGEIQVPIDVSVYLENGTVQNYKWNGINRSHEINLSTKSKVTKAIIDENHKITLDENYINNSLVLKPTSDISSFSVKFQAFLQHSLNLMSLIL